MFSSVSYRCWKIQTQRKATGLHLARFSCLKLLDLVLKGDSAFLTRKEGERRVFCVRVFEKTTNVQLKKIVLKQCKRLSMKKRFQCHIPE